jgi:hypothetical protein
VAGLDEFIERDVAHYKTENERAAYRAGMGTAAMLCDKIARRARGAARQRIAKKCGDHIWAVRDEIRVRDEQQ